MHTMRWSAALTLLLVAAIFVTSATSEKRFSLLFDIDSQSLKEFYLAGQEVVLAFQPEVVGGWFTVNSVIKPFQYNYVNWNTSGLSIFASAYQLNEGVVIDLGSWHDAQLGLLYPCEQGSFGRPRSAAWIPQNQIGTLNNGSSMFAFGLAQDIQVNGKWQYLVPLFASELLGFEHVAYDVTEPTVHIFLASNVQQVGLVTRDLYTVALSRISSVKFGSSTEQHVAWDRNTGRFTRA